MKGLAIIGLCLIGVSLCRGQLILQGDYNFQDSILVAQAYQNARQAVQLLYEEMQLVWEVDSSGNRSKRVIRQEQWRDNETLVRWLGPADQIRAVVRRVKALKSKFEKPFILDVIKGDEGRCNRRLAAWAVPYGPVKIRLCQNFLNIEPDLAAKFLIHEVGHESGLLLHRNVYNCQGALNAAYEEEKKAKKNPETYAWLAMSYLGLDCYEGRRRSFWRRN